MKPILLGNLFLLGAGLIPQTMSGQNQAQGRLTFDNPQQRELVADETHVWSMSIEQGQYVEVDVSPEGFDVVVRVASSSGGGREFDASTGAERARWIAARSGQWRVEVTAFEEGGAGTYTIRWRSQRVAATEDRQLVEADSLLAIARAFESEHELSEAVSLYERAVATTQRVLGADHSELAASLNGLGLLYKTIGRYDDAEPPLRRAVVIWERALGTDHPDVAFGLNNLASVFHDQGRYAAAEGLYQRATDIWERFYGPEHPQVATGLNNLALLYRHQGRLPEAEALFTRSRSLWEQAYGSEHPDVALSLHNLASLLHDQGRLTEAERLFERSLVVWQASYGAEHPHVAASLNSLAVLYRELGRDADAERTLERSLAVRERALGPDHPDIALSLYGLAALYTDRDDIEGARAPIERAITILDESPAYPDARIAAYALRASLHKRSQNLPEALADLEEAIRAAEDLRPHIGGGEETRATFFKSFRNHFDQMVSWQLEAGDVEAAFEYAERRRGRVLLDQLASGQVDLRSSIAADVREELEAREARAQARLAEYQQRLTVLRSRDELPAAERRQRIVALQDTLRSADADYRSVYAEIKNASPLWRSYITSGGEPVALTAVQRRLVPEDGLVLLYQVGADASYVFAIPPRRQTVEVFPLVLSERAADAFEVDAGGLTAKTLRAMLGGPGADMPGIVEQLATPGTRFTGRRLGMLDRLHALWEVLLPDTLWRRVSEAAEVVVIPDAALHYLPFEALVVRPEIEAGETRYWLDEGPVIRYAPSVTALSNIAQRSPARFVPGAKDASILSLSDPIYSPAEVSAALETAEPVAQPALTLLTQRTRDSFQRAGGSLLRLPGTALETSAIRDAYGELAETIQVLQGLDASEHTLRESLDGKRYLHLATHGVVDDRRGALFASLAMTPPPGETATMENDGYLQLHEIYDLSLDDVELAVLSACESNIGTEVEGEGVFALSRGFLAAGARRVVASQWSVDDASTAALMGAFFQQVVSTEQLGRRVDYARALWTARQSVRSEARWRLNPYYWAPFILTGM